MLTPRPPTPRATRASKSSAFGLLLYAFAACLFPLAALADLTLQSGSYTSRVSILEIAPASVASWSNAPILNATGGVVRADGRLILTLAGTGGTGSGEANPRTNSADFGGYNLSNVSTGSFAVINLGDNDLSTILATLYPASNPSNFTTLAAAAALTNNLATQIYVTSATNALWQSVLGQGYATPAMTNNLATVASLAGYYPTNNPSGYVTQSITNSLVASITGGGTWSLSGGSYTFTPTGVTAAVQSALDARVSTDQTGSVSISGTVTAGAFVGNGAGLVGVWRRSILFTNPTSATSITLPISGSPSRFKVWARRVWADTTTTDTKFLYGCINATNFVYGVSGYFTGIGFPSSRGSNPGADATQVYGPHIGVVTRSNNTQAVWFGPHHYGDYRLLNGVSVSLLTQYQGCDDGSSGTVAGDYHFAATNSLVTSTPTNLIFFIRGNSVYPICSGAVFEVEQCD